MNQIITTLNMSNTLTQHMCMCCCNAMPFEDREIPV